MEEEKRSPEGESSLSLARVKLGLAERHLQRVRRALDPLDWADLALYGFYCTEAAVEAAALEKGIRVQKQHWARVQSARELHRRFGAPDVSTLLRNLNEARKREAYGDVPAPELDPQEVVVEIERFVGAVRRLLDE